MRVTTNSLYNNYLEHLGSVASQLDKAREKAKNFRKYNKVEDDPGNYALESRVIREMGKNKEFKASANRAEARLQDQDQVMQNILALSKDLSKKYGLEAINGTNAAQRGIYANEIESLQKSMVQLLNTNENGDFLFAGADGKNVPFELDNGRLYYRGVDVISDELKPENGKTLKPKHGLDELNNEKLYYDLGFGLTMNKETSVADSSTGEYKVKPSSAFDIAMPGLKAIGWADKYDTYYSNDTIHKERVEVAVDKGENIITIAGQMAKMLKEYDSNGRYVENVVDESGRLMTYANADKTSMKQVIDATSGISVREKDVAFDRYGDMINRSTGQKVVKTKGATGKPDVYWNKNDIATKSSDWNTSFSTLLKKFDAAYSRVLEAETNIGVKMNFVSTTKARIDMSDDILVNHYNDIVSVDPEDAFMDYSYRQYLYNTALRIGSNIIPKSLAEMLPM